MLASGDDSGPYDVRVKDGQIYVAQPVYNLISA